MPKQASPFSGIKLSDLGPARETSLDQQLFNSTAQTRGKSKFFTPAEPSRQETKVAGNQVTSPATQTPGNHATTKPSNHDTIGSTEENLVETVRVALKELGREAGTHRYTPEEKKALEEVVYEYHRRGVETSGNQIIRIGLNYLLEDYRLHKNDSILARVLERLNA